MSDGAKVLVVGGGGREHAIVHYLKASTSVSEVYCAPGNAGIGMGAKLIDLKAGQIEELAIWASAKEIDLTVVGPEDPLAAGISDTFAKKGLKCFGPSSAAAQIEASKIFAKRLMRRAHNRTAEAFLEETGDIETAKHYVKEIFSRYGGAVIKADGLAAGKGVKVKYKLKEALDAVDELKNEKLYGTAGRKLLIEEPLKGEEFSYIGFTDGKLFEPLLPSQDHKRRFDGDKGDNTGGMGAISPTPVVTPEVDEEMRKIMNWTIREMEHDGRPYKGVLYAGCMLTEDGPKVLEYNCRFGDPETQPTLMMLEDDIYGVIDACVNERLYAISIDNRPGAAACVVMASGGYPGKYEKGKPITFGEGLMDVPEVKIFHAGTKMEKGRIVTNGGRVLGVTAYGKDHAQAIGRAYAAVGHISWEGEQHRTDIGRRALQKMEG